MSLLFILNGILNQRVFESQVGMGYDESKFKFSQEPNDYDRVCLHCGEAEGHCHCDTPCSFCEYYPDGCGQCALFERYEDRLQEAREVEAEYVYD